MSQSPLATYSLYSPNRSWRDHPIMKITPHHMASRMSAQRCCEIFMSESRKASANYCIGPDGDIACSVPEEYQAWTSSDWWNDQHSVTIEVSNSECGGDWPITEASWNALVDLCVDICQRNGIKGLTWTGDAGGSLTCHYMFAPTACPGPYLGSRMGMLADQVNFRLYGATKKEEKLKPIDIPAGGAHVYRLRNPHNKNVHHYVTSKTELNACLKSGWVREPNGDWESPDTGLVVHRLANNFNGQHHYTTDVNEVNDCIATGWVYEGSCFASGRPNKGKPVYQLYNRWSGEHFFTPNADERDDAKRKGWRDDGVVFRTA